MPQRRSMQKQKKPQKRLLRQTLTIDQRVKYIKHLADKGPEFLEAGLKILQSMDKEKEIVSPKIEKAISEKLKESPRAFTLQAFGASMSPADCFTACAPAAAIPGFGHIAYAACVAICIAAGQLGS